MLIFAGEGANHLINNFSVGTDSVMPTGVHGLEINVGSSDLSRFANGENRVWIKDNCENQEIIIFQNFSSPVDQNIIQFCLMVDAIKRQNPKKITAVIPWLGYAKQDKVFRKGEPLAAEVVAKIISSLPIDKVFLLDIHHPNIKNFFTIPVEELSASDILIEKITSEKFLIASGENNWCVVAPDFGALERNKYIAEKLNLSLFQIDKKRDKSTGRVTIDNIICVGHPRAGGDPGLDSPLRGNDINGKRIIMIDDMILSGGTVVKDCEFLKSQGAGQIYFFATHLDPTPETFANLKVSQAEKIFVSNSLDFQIPVELHDKIVIVDVARMILQNLGI